MKTTLTSLAICICLSTFAFSQESDPYAAAVTYDYGQSRLPLTTIEAEIRKASPDQYKSIEAKLLDLIKDPKSTTPTKKFACQKLQLIGSAQSVPVIAPLLADEQVAHSARIALEAIPDPLAAAALRDASQKLEGKLLIGVINSIGARRDAQAVGLLAPRAGAADAAIANADVNALGQIATPEAVAAIEKSAVPNADSARALIDAAQTLASAGNKAEAARIFRSFHANQIAPPPVRVAAFNGVISVETPANAAATIVRAFTGDNAKLRTAALSAVGPRGSAEVRLAVAQAIPTLKPDNQADLLTVLADQTDIELRPILLNVLSGATDKAVRDAVLDGLVYHGLPQDVAMLAKSAAAEALDNSPNRKVLARMVHPGIDEALLPLLSDADAKVRAVIIATLADRRTPAALAGLVKATGDADPAVVEAALKALANVGTAAEVGGLVKIIVATNDGGRRDAAANAIKSIAGRTADKGACSAPILASLSSASPAAKVALLGVLQRVGDEASLKAVVAAVAATEADVKEAAVRALAEWTDFAAGAHLIDLARASGVEKDAILALRGAIRIARNVKDAPAAQRANLLKSVLDLAKRNDEKKQALSALGDVPSPAALDLLQGYFTDAQLKSDAATAAVRLAREIGPIDRKKALATLTAVKGLDVGAPIKTLADAAIESLKQVGMVDGFIVSWLVSGPYKMEGKDLNALFNQKFAPEDGKAETVSWQPIAAEKNRIVDLNKPFGGENRVAYLTATITSDADQEISLEMGSDDGIKAFLNGKQVHAKNAVRPCVPGQDKVKIKLAKGPNTLLLKIVQGGGDWSACARLRSADGKEIKGVSVSLGKE